jgi:leader peptidase (prepilin peptidase)/N-methyltransferase
MTIWSEGVLAAAIGVGIFGLVIGSFLNVVIYRVPNGMSLVRPASTCPKCGSAIKGYDNVPVLSWLLLRGKCRNCKSGISARYPAVEIGTAVFFGIVAAALTATAVSNPTPAATVAQVIQIAAFLYLCAVTVALAMIDIDTHTLPNSIVLPGYIVGILMFTAAGVIGGDYASLVRAGIGMVGLGAIYFVIALIYPGGMGLGDVKLAGVLGLFLGWTGWGALAVGAFSAFLLGGLFGIGLMIFRGAKRKSGIPFGPWMLGGAWLGVFFGNEIWSGYLSLMGLAGR